VIRFLFRRAWEDARVDDFLSAIRATDPRRTDTRAFPRIVLAGTVA
jgi:hypothetical protein